jgi:DNA-directed RNA polymerase specialized sigma24 family protein
MSQDTPFLDFIRRVRAGDEQASTELVRIYEPALRAVIRVRLRDGGLRRLLEPADICQSVLGDFFARAARGHFELERPEQLIRLLGTMARNRLTNHTLRQRAACRDYRRTECSHASAALVDRDPGPSEVAVGAELLSAVQSRLSAEERLLAERHFSGKGWPEIAAEAGGSPDGLRMRLGRALDRVARELRRAH